MRWHPDKLGIFILTAVLAMLAVFPLLWMFFSAFKGPADVTSISLLPSAPTLANFIYVFTQVPFLWMVQIGIANFQTQYAGSWNYIMAASTVAALPTLLLFFVFQRQLVTSIKSSGFK